MCKHSLLKSYFPRFAGKVGSTETDKRLVYVDTHAGPGHGRWPRRAADDHSGPATDAWLRSELLKGTVIHERLVEQYGFTDNHQRVKRIS